MFFQSKSDFGPQFHRKCPYANCVQEYHAYTENGANALMEGHVSDHKRGIVPNSAAASKLSQYDKDFLKEAHIGWEDDGGK